MNIRDLQLFFARRPAIAAVLAVLCFGSVLIGPRSSDAQQAALIKSSSPPPLHFRIGEKLTYNVSFGKFINAAYVEMSVVSRGKLSGLDAVELQSRMKTLGLVSAAFFPFDEDRTVFASPDTGLPLYVSKSVNDGPIPKETIGNYLAAPTLNFDLLTLIYKAREMSGTGTYSLFENQEVYTVAFQTTVGENVKTEAGSFDTVVSSVQSDYLSANGIKELKINFSTDENHIPVLIRIKTAKGDFRASLLAIQLPQPTVIVAPPTATIPLPGPGATPKPKPTPTPYIDNVPLSPDLGFDIGETLNFNISEGGRPLGVITLQAKERKQFQNEDSLLLEATVTSVDPGNAQFGLGDLVQVQVDPETLAPRWIKTKFSGDFKEFNQAVTFDRRTGTISFAGAKIDAPIGTHTILSLLYAMRSFNLRPSKDPNNPVNDTRVAVFWESQPYIFTLRPGNPEDLMVNGQSVSAQSVIIKTGNEELDKLGLKVWLSANGRFPVRLVWGAYQADLIPPAKTIP